MTWINLNPNNRLVIKMKSITRAHINWKHHLISHILSLLILELLNKKTPIPLLSSTTNSTRASRNLSLRFHHKSKETILLMTNKWRVLIIMNHQSMLIRIKQEDLYQKKYNKKIKETWVTPLVKVRERSLALKRMLSQIKKLR